MLGYNYLILRKVVCLWLRGNLFEEISRFFPRRVISYNGAAGLASITTITLEMHMKEDAFSKHDEAFCATFEGVASTTRQVQRLEKMGDNDHTGRG